MHIANPIYDTVFKAVRTVHNSYLKNYPVIFLLFLLHISKKYNIFAANINNRLRGIY
jgi:hypothetical protein